MRPKCSFKKLALKVVILEEEVQVHAHGRGKKRGKAGLWTKSGARKTFMGGLDERDSRRRGQILKKKRGKGHTQSRRVLLVGSSYQVLDGPGKGKTGREKRGLSFGCIGEGKLRYLPGLHFPWLEVGKKKREARFRPSVKRGEGAFGPRRRREGGATWKKL